MHDYFYRAQSGRYSFFRVPTMLFTDDQYKYVSAEAKVLYGLLLARMDLSARNSWLDDEKETIVLTNEADDFYEVSTFNYALKMKLAVYAKKHPNLCRLKETTKEGSATYVVDKARLSLRLTEPYSEARRQVARKQAKDNCLGEKTSFS